MQAYELGLPALGWGQGKMGPRPSPTVHVGTRWCGQHYPLMPAGSICLTVSHRAFPPSHPTPSSFLPFVFFWGRVAVLEFEHLSHSSSHILAIHDGYTNVTGGLLDSHSIKAFSCILTPSSPHLCMKVYIPLHPQWCLKPQIALNPIYTFFSLLSQEIYLFIKRRHFTAYL
jgi:hypothetical protein